MTRVTVFSGPTLPWSRDPRVDWLGPAAAGDLLRLADARPHTVLLIDGVFGTARAPWHKEILVLLSHGFRVSGAASMGALRAAELASCGMRPIGAVARAVLDGRIVGDDEVAVVHAPEALGYRAMSIAQVDVRARLVGALRRRLLDADTARRIRAAARAIHYKDRSWAAVASAAESLGRVPPAAVRWLRAGGPSFKTVDAARALAVVLADVGAPLACPPPPETVYLRRLRAEIDRARRPPPSS
jgi:hypothetical protein